MMKNIDENNEETIYDIDKALEKVLSVFDSNNASKPRDRPFLWRLAGIAQKADMLSDIVKALCHVDSAILSILRANITDELDARGYGMTDNCEVCGVFINRSANDKHYDTIPLCAKHIEEHLVMEGKISGRTHVFGSTDCTGEGVCADECWCKEGDTQ